MTARILFHVQHLLGTGHLKRAAVIARALGDAGFEVVLASGGMPLAGLATGRVRLVQLPPVRAADLSFKTLVDENGAPAGDEWRERRRRMLLELFAGMRPDVVITELFPFGRRMLDFELLPLLAAAQARRPRALVLCSLRDILVAPRDRAKTALALERTRTLYDYVLVHGDPALIDLPASLAEAAEIKDRIRYTGYVSAPDGPDAPAGDGEDEILVSAGGGAVGARLLDCAIAAQAAMNDGRRWRLLLGADLPADARARVAAAAGPRLIVEPARSDFASLLRRCHVSVSQGGYNTVMEILDSSARAVLVPFAGGGETEQATRAAVLEARGWAETLDEARLTPETLAAAIGRAARRPRPDTAALRRDGAAETARFIGGLVGRQRATA